MHLPKVIQKTIIFVRLILRLRLVLGCHGWVRHSDLATVAASVLDKGSLHKEYTSTNNYTNLVESSYPCNTVTIYAKSHKTQEDVGVGAGTAVMQLQSRWTPVHKTIP